MNKKITWYTVALVLLVGSSGYASSDRKEILYSINMPGNPFQQPYYQMMIKADNENNAYTFDTAFMPAISTFYGCNQENFCGTGTTNVVATTDYVSLYAVPMSTPQYDQLSLMHGMTPYTFRGYTEGAANTLYLQRPAQVQLPFNPNAQMDVNATLPDYSDVFIAQTAADLYKSLQCSADTCLFTSNQSTMPSWYTYIPRSQGNHDHRGTAAIFYGTVADLAKPQVRQTTFSPYVEAGWGWDSFIARGVTKMRNTYTEPDAKFLLQAGNNWPQNLLPNVLASKTDANFIKSLKTNVLASKTDVDAFVASKTNTPKYYFNPPQTLHYGLFSVMSWVGSEGQYFTFFGVTESAFLLFAPIVSPGYAGDAVPYPTLCNGCTDKTIPLQTVIAAGDLTGNYASKTNPYIASAIPTATYDGVAVNGMSYFQLFAQNMQWFTRFQGDAYSYSLASLPPTTYQNITPGQGVFSDAIQLAAMQAPVGASKTPVFFGSTGPLGITGPVTMTGSFQKTGGGQTNFNIPQAFLSKITRAHFKADRYLQAPSTSTTSTTAQTWSGGLAAGASEDPFQYYQGVTTQNITPPYLPVYFSDPGRPVDQPGWNYCPAADIKYAFINNTANSQMCYDTATSPMTNFYAALNGTR